MLQAPWSWIWLALGIVVLIFELAAAVTKRSGDTISDHVWHILKYPTGRVVFITLWVWLSWHFVIETLFFPGLRAAYTEDLAIIAATAILVAVLNRNSHPPSDHA